MTRALVIIWEADHDIPQGLTPHTHTHITLSAHLLWLSSTCTHHAVVVDELQLVVGQDVAPVVHQVQGHLSGGHARLTARPASAHGEQRSDVQLLLACRRPWPEEEKDYERCPEERRVASGWAVCPRRTRAHYQHGSRWAEPEQLDPGAAAVRSGCSEQSHS